VLKFVGFRAIQLVVVTLFATFLTYSLIFINESPDELITTLLQQNSGSEEARARVGEQINADDPFLVRYGKWVGDTVRYDLGESYQKNTSVNDLMEEALPRTVALIVYAQILAAYRANTWIDRGLSSASIGLLAIPNYVMGVLLVYLFALQLHWFPVLAETNLSPFDLRSYFLPSLSLAVGQVAVYMRLLRTDMITTLQEDFIGMAKAKGLPTRRILLRHALRPSSLSLVTVLGINTGALIGGAVFIEQIYNMPGMGNLLLTAILTRDIMVTQAIVAVVALGFVVINFIVDLVYAVLDPRIRV
jgi:peptide/nickel transport system permease protein